MKKLILAVAFVLSLSSFAHAARVHPEEYYVNWWCGMWGGEQEVTLVDGTRADCNLWNAWIIEFDFGDKWYEALGQALHYGTQTGIMPGIVLILEDQDQDKYWFRLAHVIATYRLPVQLWTIRIDANGTPY